MIARAKREYLAELVSLYAQLRAKKAVIAAKMVEIIAEGGWQYREGDGRMRIPASEVPLRVEDLIYRYEKSDEYLIEKLAWLVGELENIRPFGKKDREAIVAIVNRQLEGEGFARLGKEWQDENYKRAVRRYRRWGKVDDLERGLMLAVSEALHREIAELSGGKVLPIKRWARAQGITVNAARNQARRQTIPAFRKNGKWVVA